MTYPPESGSESDLESGVRIRIALAQINLLVGDIQANTRKILQAAQEAGSVGAQLVLFPELTLTGYPPEDLLLRPGLLAASERALETLCREAPAEMALVVGHPMREQGRLYNAVSVVSGGEILARYRKRHLPNYGVFDERRYFQPGRDTGVFEFRGTSFGLSLCEDVWFPGPARQAARAGARILLNLNASPFHMGKTDERFRVVEERVRETGMAVCYLNLVGGQDELVFDGGSFVADAQGHRVLHMRRFEEQIACVDIEMNGRGEPVLNAVEPSADPPLAPPEAEIYQALVLGVRDYVVKNGFQGALLGLSGGIDSALTLAVAVDALGAGKVRAVMMPSAYTAEISRSDAAEQARILGVDYHIVPIARPVETFSELLAPEFQGLPMDATEENIQARCRGLILMALSNKSGRILLTTGNKSEMAVGYATLYGDMAGGFAPLKDCPKTLVYRLAEYRNSLGRVIPQRVIDREPSAELRPDQKDSDSLPEYEILDAILRMFVEEDRTVAEIVAAGYEQAMVERVAGLVLRNEYKRRQAPPGVRITQRAFGRDRRYPITSGYGRSPVRHR